MTDSAIKNDHAKRGGRGEIFSQDNRRKANSLLFSFIVLFSIYCGSLIAEAHFFDGDMHVSYITLLAGSCALALILAMRLFYPHPFYFPLLVCVSVQLTFITVGSYLHEMEFYSFVMFMLVCCASMMRNFKTLAVCVAVMIGIDILNFLFYVPTLVWMDHFRFFMKFLVFLFGSGFILIYVRGIERKEGGADRALAAFSSLLNKTPNYMLIADDGGRVRYISDPMLKFARFARYEMALGRPLVDLFQERALKLLFAKILDADGFFETVIKVDLAGEVHHLRIVADKLSGAMSGTFIDISDITQMEESRISAEEANKGKSSFLATMSHEIRTPMNAIIGISQIQLQKGGLPPDYAEALEKIYSSGSTLLGIINDILDMSKIETGKLELNAVEYDMPSLINDAVQLNMVRIGSKPIEFSLEVDETLPSKLCGDELRLKQILNNLLSNAIKYTEDGKVELLLDHVECKDGVLLRFIVKDTGQGMTRENLQKLFSEFVRFNADGNREVEGTGLGLSITKKLVEMMDGHIEVESEYGKGTTFTVTVRQKAASERGAIGRDLAEELHNFSFKGHSQNANVDLARKLMPSGKVLVVDDVSTNLYVAEGLLAPYKLKLETAMSGFAAIEKVESGETFDIIFMDQMMPRLNGVEATRRLREFGYTGVIIALTANALSGTREMFMENGFDDFLSKPIDITKLDAALLKWMPKEKVKDNAEGGVRNKDNAEGGMRNAELKSNSNSKSSADDVGVDVDVRSAFRIPHSALTIDGVDVKLGIARTGGKVAGYLRTLEVFCEDGRNKTDEIKKALGDDDLPLYTIYVHALKSALANIGADGLSKRAGDLEDAGNRGDRVFIDNNTDTLLNDLQTMLSDIDKAVAAQKEQRVQNQSHQKEIDTNALGAILADLKLALDDLDPSAINNAVKKLEPFENAADDIGDKIKQITRSVLNGDYDGAAAVIDQCIKK